MECAGSGLYMCGALVHGSSVKMSIRASAATVGHESRSALRAKYVVAVFAHVAFEADSGDTPGLSEDDDGDAGLAQSCVRESPGCSADSSAQGRTSRQSLG